ncbi:MAG: CNNM domain-containing protein [Zoogloeaceae bacterium]|nr:CNNM domain-containing protein [Zoogloeaceae bacterium]
MDDLPLGALLVVLAVLLLLSAFFSMSETAMMAANRYRLRHRAQTGDLGAKLALALLAHTDRLLGVILLGNNLVNTAAAAITSVLSIRFFGNSQWALGIATLIATFVILVFSEITPKIIGATYSDAISRVLGFIFTPLLKFFYPAVWFVNLFASGLLKLMGLSLKPAGNTQLSPEELRALVMESRELIPPIHGTMLLNLFDLSKIPVEEVMTPRSGIEILDLEQPWAEVQEQIRTSMHARLPVCAGSLDQLVGLLSMRRVLGHMSEDDFGPETLKALLKAPYYIPAGTSLFAQLSFFRENRQRFGFVVDEYGEILGILTLEDIVEEIVGEFTTALPGVPNTLAWDKNDSVLVSGSQSLRDLNRKLGLQFPLDGPKTLNGLILEQCEDIPEACLSLKHDGVVIEIVQTEGKSVKTARIFKWPPKNEPT